MAVLLEQQLGLEAKRHTSDFMRLWPLTVGVFDGLAILLSLLAAFSLRDTLLWEQFGLSLPDLTLVGVLIALTWIGALTARGCYERDAFGAGVDEYKRVVTASALAAGVVGILCYLTKYPLSRGFFIFAFLVGVPVLLVTRWALRRYLKRARVSGHFRRRVLIVGTVDAIDDVAHVLQRETWLGYEVVGALTPPEDLTAETPSGVPVLANADDAAAIALTADADLVLYAGGGAVNSRQMRKVMWDLESAHIHVVVVPSMTDIASERISIRPVAGLPLVYLRGPSTLDASRWAKRTFDIVVSGLLIAMCTPVLAAIALTIRLNDRGSVMFRQQRVGLDGRTFECFKFRTMVVDADRLIEQLRAKTGASALLFKDKNDPRITPPGKWLRKFSLDELPQLFNVFRGDMSLVGPRPQVQAEVDSYDDFMARRLRVRPGMTGLWQVSGRNDLDVSDAVRLDVYYVDNWSMLQDVTIMFRTVSAVLTGRGAY